VVRDARAQKNTVTVLAAPRDLAASADAIDGQRIEPYSMRMKRTNLVLDEHLLDEAFRLSGERTYSAAVGRALADFVRRARANRILELAGSGRWDGDLTAMRRDRPLRPTRRRSSGSR
jgi:Arc/MetJ family transcription regulator